MINPRELVQGECYFLLLYYHPKLDIPMITTYIYVGKNVLPVEGTSKDHWFFQDPESYLEHGSFLNFSEKIEHEKFVVPEDCFLQMYDLDRLIDELRDIKDRREKR